MMGEHQDAQPTGLSNPGTTTEPQWWGHRPSLVALLVILIAAAGIRAYLFGGFIGLDDGEYARFAHRMAHGTFHLGGYTGPAVFPLRIGIIAPTALAFRVLGPGEWPMVLYPFVLSLCGIGLAYACAGALFGARAGLIAAVLAGILPWDIDGSTRLVPDLPAAFYAALAVTTILLTERTGTRRRPLLFAAGLAAGIAFGLSWLCKESVAYLAPFGLLWMILTTKSRGTVMVSLWAGVAAGSLAILLGEMMTYHRLTGDFLFRFHEVDRNYHQWENSFFTEGSDFGWQRGEDYRQALMRRLFVTGPSMILLNRSFLFLPLIGLLVAVYAWWRGDRSFLAPALWLATLVLMFNFSSSSPGSYVPLALFNRYLFPIFFPAILLTAGFLHRTVWADRTHPGTAGPGMRWAGIGVMVMLIWFGGIQLLRSFRNPSIWMAEMKPLANRIRPGTVLYADALSLRGLEFFEGYPAETSWTELSTVTSSDDIPPGSLVLINPAHIEWLNRNAGMWVSWPAAGPTDPKGYPEHSFYRAPPPSWSRIWGERNVSLYRVEPAAEGQPRSTGSL